MLRIRVQGIGFKGAGFRCPGRFIQGVVFTQGVGFRIGCVPQEQKMLKGHLPRIIDHQVY